MRSRTCIIAGLVLALMLTAASPARAGEPKTIGYVGGSISWLAVDGAQQLGFKGFWGRYDVRGGTLSSWARDPSYLEGFTAMAEASPPDAIWWQLALKDFELTDGRTLRPLLTQARHVLARIQAEAPGVPIYASALADYSVESSCSDITVTPPLMDKVVARLIADGAVLRGPDMPTLTPDLVKPGGVTCHQSGPGQLLHGQVLAKFFAGV